MFVEWGEDACRCQFRVEFLVKSEVCKVVVACSTSNMSNMQAHQYRMFQWVSTTLRAQYVVVLYVRCLKHRVIEELSNPGKCIQELL